MTDTSNDCSVTVCRDETQELFTVQTENDNENTCLLVDFFTFPEEETTNEIKYNDANR